MAYNEVHKDAEKELFVVDYKELFFIFAVFVFILVLLYPKDSIQKQIMAETSNYDLSMLYLKDFLKNDPKNETLMILLAEQSLRSGKKDLALRLLNLLLHSKEKALREKAIRLSYELKKDNYYYLKSQSKRSAQKEKLRELFLRIYNEKIYDDSEIDLWYEESLFLGLQEQNYFFLQKKIEKNPHDIALLERAYYLSIVASKEQESLKYLKMLHSSDRVHEKKWVDEEYYFYIKYKYFNKAENLLKKYAKSSIQYQNKLAAFYIMRKKYHLASREYMQLFKRTRKYKAKREYFFKAVNALQSGKQLKSAVRLAARYENYYIKDKTVRKFLLKLYLASGNLDKAAKLSTKLLNSRYR